MIEIKNISKKFGKITALDKVSVSFSRGECIALLGPNGSGKTTLIKSLLGMVVPDSGTIHFNQELITGKWKYRSQLGYMPQIGRYPENMTIAQVIDMMKDIRKKELQHFDEDLVNITVSDVHQPYPYVQQSFFEQLGRRNLRDPVKGHH